MLTPCSSCRRYIRAEETACPFCTAAPKTAHVAAAIVMAATALTACQGAKQEPAGTSNVAPPTATVPATTPEASPDPQANNTPPTPPAPEPAEPEPEPAEPKPATSVADQKTPPTPIAPGTGRPMVARYGISPRLPLNPPKPTK